MDEYWLILIMEKQLTKMTKHQIVSQGAIAMAGQSNAIASTVSSLLESFA